MPICHRCGEQIEFRYLDGQATPIHINGNYCSGKMNGASSGCTLWSIKHFRTFEAYTNPNAECPVCKRGVFFYLSPFGGRVFFDNLGWPWPKHPCTYNQLAQSRQITKPKRVQSKPTTLKNAVGQLLDIYEFEYWSRQENGWLLKFKRARTGAVFRVFLSDKLMRQTALEIDDFKRAPSFIAPPPFHGITTRVIYFICERLGEIITIELPKAV